MVGHVVVQIQERQQRAQEALSLPGRQAKHQAQGDRRLDGVVRVLALSAWLPARRPRRVPVGELAIGESEPDGQTPASAETRLVLPPIPDTVGLLDVLPLGARETRHAGPRISGWRAIIDRDRELCTKAGRGRRGWRKLHLGVDGSRVIVACALTEPTADDAMTGISLVDEVDGHLTRVTADPAYDTLAFYGAAGARGARVVVPPTKTASLSRRGARSGARDRTIRRAKALGRRRWKKASGDHQHARVENAFFRYTSIVGDCLRTRSSSGQRREAVLACHVLNRMTELGRPVSYRIGR